MKRTNIFLSYRRDDSPGYVSRLEDELERAFGHGSVFRDATDIPGGTQWKSVIEENLRRSAAMLLVIGPRWEQIWKARKSDAVNYVALELERAHEMGVPIIPVTLDGVQLSKGLDLGSINFIFDNQFHDISDRQGRWSSDFGRLVNLLEGIEGIGAARTATGDDSTPPPRFGTAAKWVAAVVALTLIAAIWMVISSGERSKTERVVVEPVPDTIAVQKNRENTEVNVGAGPPTEPALVPRKGARDKYPVPNINGTWRSRNGGLYEFRQNDDGTFVVKGPEQTSGRGEFYTDRPRKFVIEIAGVGRGEFSVSASDTEIIGWIEVNGRQQYDTLKRVQLE